MGTVRLTLKQKLEEKALTRYWLAKNTGIMYHTVNDYYNNKLIRVDTYILAKFCDALGCDICDILEYVPENTLRP